MDFQDILPRIFIAFVLGAIIGLEREFTQKSAGLRTHILVTLGSTIFTLVSMSDFYYGLSHLPYDPTEDNRIVRDPSRVAAQIVTGIGFIGGGAVLRYGATVRGLTTAASLWTMASIGMLVGIGQTRLAIIATLLTFLVLFTIGKIERHFFTKNIRSANRLKIHIVSTAQAANPSQSWIEDHFKDNMIEVRIHSDAETDRMEMNFILNTMGRKNDVNEISRRLCRLPGVISATVKAYYENEDFS